MATTGAWLTTGNLTNATNETGCGLSLVPEGEETLFTAIALVCVFISSLSTTFGLFWQKAAQENFSKAKHEPNGHLARKYKCRGMGLWTLGFMAITVVSFGLDLFSLSVLGQSVVVPLLASLEIAENQVFAPCMVHEVCVKKYDITATIFIIVGALLTTIFGPAGVEICSIQAIIDLFALIPFVVFQGIVIAVLIFCFALMWNPAACVDKFRFMLFSFVAGALGGEQNLFLKGIGVLVGFAFAGENTFGEWQIWVFLICMAGLAVLQLVFLNMGLARFEALQFIPAFTVLYILMGVMVGLIFYEEYLNMDALSWGMFSLGIAFIIAALAILGQKQTHETDTHPTEVDESGKPVVIKMKSFAPMLVSGAALEHLKHIAKPLKNRIMLLRAFRRAHSMSSIPHHTIGKSAQRVAPETAMPVHRNKIKKTLGRSMSMEPVRAGQADDDIEVTTEEVEAAQGDVHAARKRKALAGVFSDAKTSESKTPASSGGAAALPAVPESKAAGPPTSLAETKNRSAHSAKKRRGSNKRRHTPKKVNSAGSLSSTV